MPPQSSVHINTGGVENGESTTTTTTTPPGGASLTRGTMRRVDSESSFISTNSGGESQKSKGKVYRVRKLSIMGMVDWTHVVATHAPTIMAFGLVVLFGQIVHQVVLELDAQVQHTSDQNHLHWSLETTWAVVLAIHELFAELFTAIYESHGFAPFSPAVKTTALVLILFGWFIRRDNAIYLMSFATFKAPDEWKCTHDEIVQMMRCQGTFTEESLQFMQRILERSGTGPNTAWPPGIVQCLRTNEKADRSMEASRNEAEVILFDVVGQALRKAQVSPKEIDILVINCSLFSPTPSLCAMVASKFQMRSDVATYNLSGMGCSASLISIDLAKKLLQAKKGQASKALVVSTEIITPNLYHGNDRGFLIQNTLFRCGGAAMVLSNSWMDGRRAWYKLLHTVRVSGTGLESYQCVYESEDRIGERGVKLSKDIVKVAGKCMEKNFTMLGPLVLPYTEQAKVVWSLAARYVCKTMGKMMAEKDGKPPMWIPNVSPYVPDFKKAFDHFCIHAGGRAVIDGIEKNMKLEHYHTEPSRMALLNYGNTSSSSIWYELGYIQEQQKTNPLKKGDRVMQVAFGSGFKCTSAVWLKL